MAITDPITILDAATTDGNKTASAVNFPSGKAILSVWGTFDGATVTLQDTPDGTNYITSKDIAGSDATATAAKNIPVIVPVGRKFRANIASAGASTNLNAKLFPLP